MLTPRWTGSVSPLALLAFGPVRAVMRLLVALIVLGLAPEVAVAQVVTGAVQGMIRSEQGQPLPGVMVTVRGAALQGERGVTSDARGRFALLALPAGNYTLQFRRIGFAPQRIIDITVHLGVTTSVSDVRLTAQATRLDEIIVSGARPLLDATSASAATTLDSSRFLALPSRRDYRSLLGLVPQANPSAFGDGTNFGGATGFENAYFVDGIHATNPLSGDGSLALPFNFIKEIQVVTGGYEAEFGRGQGAIVNVVTNSGGNQFHGQVTGFFTSQKLRAAGRWGIAERPVNVFSHYDLGLSVGGPIRRDRIWFYAAYNPLFETKEVAFTGIPVERDRLVRHTFAGKLDWRLSPSSDLAVTLIGDPSTRDAVEGAEAWTAPLTTIADPRAVQGAYRDGGVAASVRFRHQAGNRLLWTGSASYLSNAHQVAGRSGIDAFQTLARVDNFLADATSGNFGRAYRVNSTRIGADAGLTILAGRHTVKLGAAVERNVVHLPFFLASFIRTTAPDTTQWIRNSWYGRGHNLVTGLYAQDGWEISPRLRLNLGLRWETQSVAGDTPMKFSITDEFSPRAGIVYQPGRLGAHKLSASFGRFYEQLPLWAVVAWTAPFIYTQTTFPQNPLVDSTGGNGFEFTLAGYPVDPAMVGQHHDEVTVGYQRLLGTALLLGIRGFWRRMRWVIEDGVLPGSTPAEPLKFLGNPGRGALAFMPRATRNYAALELSLERSGASPLQYQFSYVLSRNHGNYPGEYETDLRIPASHFQDTLDWPVMWEHATGFLPNDRRHLIKLLGSYAVWRNLRVGTLVSFASGTPLSEFAEDPYPGDRTNVRDRGTLGRTPDLWSADFRVTYEPHAFGGRWQPRILLDVHNVGNQRQAVDFEQLHYTNPEHTTTHPNYQKVNLYQAPLSARVGVVFGF